MKKIIFSLVLISSTNAFATNSVASKYCSDESRKVLYVKPEIRSEKQQFDRSQVDKAELVANLSDGTAVIIPCFNNRVLSSIGKRIGAEIIPQESIFEIIKDQASTQFRGVGINFQSATVLVEENSLGFVKRYSVHKSEKLEKLKAAKIKRSIDNR